jgi:hypothetical protein
MTWKVIDDAARDGTKRRVKTDNETTHVGGVFKAPHWWDFGNGFMRLADAQLYPGDDLIKVTHYEVPV